MHGTTENTTLLEKRWFLRTNLTNDRRARTSIREKKKSNLMFSYIKIQLLGQFITLFQFYFYNKYERKPD